MAHEKTRSIVELVANIAIAVAAIAFVWRILFVPVPAAQARGGAPPAPVQDVKAKGLSTTVSNATRKGNTDAEVVLIEFSDFECPFCGKYARETFTQIDKEFVAAGKVQYVLRNFPLEQIHPSATNAAQAAECAGEQGKYWEMHGRLFGSQAELAQAVWTREAEALQLDRTSFERCMEGTTLSKVKADQAEGSRLGVQSTPTFFIGRLEREGTVRLVRTIRGAQSFAVFQEALNQTLSDN